MNNLVEQARTWWESSPTPTRIIAVGLAILLVICFAGAVMLASAPDYQDLFTNLDPGDAAKIAAKLDDAHVKYVMTNDETTIRVPAADKDRLRMEMIRDNLPTKSGGLVSSDWLDKISMSTTSGVQDQYIRRANEGELATTITSLNEVATAAVHITGGTDSPFAADSAPPTASVVVGLKSGMTLSSDQVSGIANLVAKSVTGLDIKNISIVDSSGNQLWDGGEDGGASGMASNRFAAESAYSEEMRKKLQGDLDLVLGTGKSLVTVHAELNYDQVHSHTIDFTKGQALSSQEQTEKYSGTGGAASAAVPAGIASNTPGAVPQYPGTAGGGGRSGTYENSTQTVNNEPSKTETDTLQAAGTPRRLAVAVLIDSNEPPATVNSITTTLATLIGSTADPTRQLSVQTIPFSNTQAADQQAAMKKFEDQQRMEQMIKIASVAAVLAVLLFMFTRSSRTAVLKQIETTRLEEERAALPAGEDGAGEFGGHMLDEPMSVDQALDEMPMPVAHAKRPKVAIPEIEEHLDVKLESVREMINSNPSTVALLMKGWIDEEPAR